MIDKERILRMAMHGPLCWIGYLFRPFSYRFLSFVIVNIIRILSISRSPIEGLRLVLSIEKGIYGVTAEEAVRYGKGTHTKHRHMGYHDFFCNRLGEGESVLDIGCGTGELSFDMAAKANANVTGIELIEKNYRKAKTQFKHNALRFIHGDAMTELPNISFNTIVMSNVLEHIENRVDFIVDVQKNIQPERWLFRVPMYERDWRVPLMDEIGLDSRLDSTHYIEYTQEKFIREIQTAGLEIVHIEIRWCEIWCEARPQGNC